MTTAKTQTPKVSVCIPTYRGAATIGQAIESVLTQSLADFDLIVIDDGSPDDTHAIVQRCADPRLVYLRNERNLGPQGNWNRCLERKVSVLDGDGDGSIAPVFGARDVLGPDGRVLTRRGCPGGHEGTIDGSVVMRACVRRGTNLIGEPGAVLFRNSRP